MQFQDPPFTLKDLREAIPEECFHVCWKKSLSYVVRDVVLIALLASIALYFDSWLLWPFYWFFQGTLFWALFVIGHDCGHGSFAKNPKVNHFFGYLLHSFLLVPYHSWRISHRNHHQHTGHVDKEEAWYPWTHSEYKNTRLRKKIPRFYLFFFAFLFYLFWRSTRLNGSHFLPWSELFKPHERSLVIRSSLCCLATLSGLIFLSYLYGWAAIGKLYWGPYLIFIMYLDVVTILHHSSPEVPWFRDSAWSFLKGNLSTVDHEYRFTHPLHHYSGIHIAHHLLPHIPHYHIRKATDAIIPILGPYYRKSNMSLFKALWQFYKHCRFISDQGDVVYYKHDA